MKQRFICSSLSLGHYLRSYIDTIPPGEDCHISIKAGEFKVDNFNLPYSVPFEPIRADITDVWTKNQLSSLIKICTAIPDQPITITINPGSWPEIFCVI